MSSMLGKILVAIDDSEPSERATEFAIRLAAEQHAQLICLHAVDWVPAVSTMEVSFTVADPEPVVEALRSEGRALIEKVSAQAKAANVPCDARLVELRPLDAILDTVKETQADVIVVGTHGRHGVARAVLGSVAEGVLRASPVPVIVVPPAHA